MHTTMFQRRGDEHGVTMTAPEVKRVYPDMPTIEEADEGCPATITTLHEDRPQEVFVQVSTDALPLDERQRAAVALLDGYQPGA